MRDTLEMNHNCPRCGYSTDRKDLFISHINRKFTCKPFLKDVSLDELKAEYASSKVDDKPFKCDCGRGYYHSSSYYKHKKACAGSSARSSNTTINNNTTNITNNITNNVNIYVMPFGEENTSYITSDFLTNCLRRRDKGFLELLQYIHFNPEHKENHNIRITNKRDNYIQKHDGEMWQYENKKKVLDELFKKGDEILDNHYYDNETDLRKKICINVMNKVDDFIKSLNKKEKDVVKPLMDDIYLLILNKSYMVLSKE